MSDFIGKPTFNQVQDIVVLSMCSALIVLLFSQLLLRKGSVRLHYHLLLLATTLGLISAAMRVSVTNYYDINVKKFAAYSVLQNSSSAFIQLAAVLALHKFTATYLGGAMPLITIMCSIGVAWTIVFIVISGLDAGGLLTVVNIRLLSIYSLIIVWGYFAFCCWTISMVIAIRFLYHRRTPKDGTRKTVVTTFALLALFVAMLAMSIIYDTVTTTIYSANAINSPTLIAGIVLNVLFAKCSVLAFVIFYQKLSVMAPLAATTKDDVYIV